MEFTVAGTVPDSDRIPFMQQTNICVRHLSGGKDNFKKQY
jgi:hypothetical protein